MSGVEHETDEWSRLTDTRKSSLQGVLLRLASVPVDLEENYGNLEQLLQKMKDKQQQWMVCGDSQVLCILLEQHQGYTKFLCYICEWGSRAQVQHWAQSGFKELD
jgi:hypothetical protein